MTRANLESRARTGLPGSYGVYGVASPHAKTRKKPSFCDFVVTLFLWTMSGIAVYFIHIMCAGLN
jgi:hypothetical protein